MMVKSSDKFIDVPFSINILIMVFVLKPIFDLFFFIEPLKYLYMGLLFLSGVFAFFGNVKPHSLYDKIESKNNNANYGVLFFFLFFLYLIFLFSVGAYTKLDSNAISEILKIISPFITVAIMVACSQYDLRKKISMFLAVVIVVNFASLPFGFSWVMWGGVKTFKGFYFFKMDLAFSLLNCLVIYYFSTMKVFDKKFIVLSLMVTIMVVLSNSRLNYMLIVLFFTYVAFVQGISVRSLIRIGLLGMAMGAIIILLYDPNKFLSPFDISNMDRFTQGRNHIWELILSRGLYEADFFQLFFGQGLFSDLELSSTFARNVPVHNAHNEVLHLLMTQGFFGLIVYIALWIVSAKYVLQHRKEISRSEKIFIFMVFSFFILQGVTTVISSFYLKTWWLVCCLVVCSSAGLHNGEKLETKK